MKTTVRICALAAIAVIFLAGCYLDLDGGAGSVGIQLPEPRSIDGTAPAGLARVYVLNGPALLTVGEGTDFAEFDLSPDETTKLTEVTVGPVPAGDGYQVVLVFGDYLDGVGSTKAFVPVEYALSGEFTVSAGQANVADVTLGVTPYVPVAVSDTLGTELRGIVVAGSSIHTASSTRLYSATASPDAFSTLDLTAGPSVPTGRTINSIALGAAEGEGPTVWANTTSALSPLDSAVLQEAFDTDSEIETFSILDSGAFINPVDSFSYGYVQFDGGLSGVRDIGSGPEWLDAIDLSDIVVGQPIYDMAVYSDGVTVDGFFATKLGAFRMPQSVLDPANSVDTAEKVFEASDFFEVIIDGVNATITQIAVGLSGDDTLYLGTPRGAVEVTNYNQIGVDVVVDSTLVPGTAGLIVEDIVTAGNYVVILTNHFLVYSTDGGTSFARVPIYASSVGKVTGMFVDTSSGVVLLSGEFGLSGIDLVP